MKKSVKKSFCFMLMLALLMAIFTPSIVHAEVARPATTTKTNDELKKESTVYAGEVFVDGVSEIQWLYSNDVSNETMVFDNLKTSLNGTVFCNLVPTLAESAEEIGLAVSTAHQTEMDINWTSASYVANQYYTGTLGTESNSNLYDANTTYKDNIDTSYASHKEDVTNSLDFNKRILSVISSNVNSEYKMIEGTLTRIDTITFGIEATTINYTSVNVTTNSATPITSAIITLTAPKVGDAVAKITKNDGYGDYDAQSVQPTVYTTTEGLTVNAYWVKGLKELSEESFYGTFEEDTYYYALIDFEAEDGYELPATFPDGIKINGQAPDEVFAVMGGKWNHCVAKIKATSVETTESSRVQIIMNANSDNAYGKFTVSGGTFDSTVKHDSPVAEFVDIGTSVTLTVTPNSTHVFTGWYNCEEYDTTVNANLGIMGWKPIGNVLSTDNSYTFTVTDSYYNIMPTFESRAGHNNIWATSGGQIAVLYENRDSEQTTLDGDHWVEKGIVVDYWKGDSITVKAKANEGFHFIGWFQTDSKASVAENYVKEPVISTEDNYTYQPGVTKISGVSEPINYITAVFEEDTETTPATATYEYIDNTANQTYTIDEDEALTFKINADYSLFETGGKVYVDGAETTEYTSKSGSTIVTLSKDFVNSLSIGEHTLKVAFNDGGEATTKFTIAKVDETTTTEETKTVESTSNNPKTGDNIVAWISLIVVSMLGVAGTIKYTKNSK